MRTTWLIPICLLLMLDSAAGQFPEPGALPVPGGLEFDQFTLPLTSDGGIAQLERAALLGDRRASALLAVMLQDNPTTDGLVKSAIHFQVAISAGCSDLDGLATRAVERLSPEQRVAFEEARPRWVPIPPVDIPAAAKGQCLRW